MTLDNDPAPTGPAPADGGPAPADGALAPAGGAPAPASPNRAATLIIPFLIGGALSVGIGVYARVHEPSAIAVNFAGFSGALAAKTWIASLAFVFALVQVASALAMYGKLPGLRTAPSWTGTLHRWSGRIAFLLAVPVAIHCLYAVGFEAYSTRVLVHSLLGCFFFGVFAVKMLLLPRKGLPGWLIPVLGGLVFTALAGLWLTSSLWFFTTIGVKF